MKYIIYKDLEVSSGVNTVEFYYLQHTSRHGRMHRRREFCYLHAYFVHKLVNVLNIAAKSIPTEFIGEYYTFLNQI